jgi:membrane-bound ClpP family serine protease
VTSYEVTWTDGTREVIVVERIGRDGWVRVEGERWVNVALARSVQAKR